MAIPPLIGNPYNGYINPYYWVDDHPLLYGNNGSLDPSTYCTPALRILGMSWGVKTTFLEAPGVSLGGSGVSIGGVRILRVVGILGI